MACDDDPEVEKEKNRLQVISMNDHLVQQNDNSNLVQQNDNSNAHQIDGV